MVDEALARRFMQRFEGYTTAYGTYDKNKTVTGILGGKVEIKSTAITKREPVTLKLWLDHLNGVAPLGIIPIRSNNTCLWGCIDIDQYGVDVVELQARIARKGLPLILAASKSGGAHAFLVMMRKLSAPPAASVMKYRLEEMAAMLGYGGSEIFPKQSTVLYARGDLGSWLNMPYFGDTRWAYRPDGSTMPPEEFMNTLDALEQTSEWLLEVDDATKSAAADDTGKKGDVEFSDGPPCMQHLSAIGIGEGGRNEGIMAMGIFAKKKFPNNWEEVLERWNRLYAMPPLPAAEILDVIKRLKLKDYFYPCKKQPIKAHCNSALCRTRKHGVASGSPEDMPVIGGLSCLPGDEELWFLDVGDTRIELTTEQLMNYRVFQRVLAAKYYKMFTGMAQSDWNIVVGAALREVNVLDVRPEVGHLGQFVELLDDFVNNKHRATTREEIRLGRPWLDADLTVKLEGLPDEARHFFRLRDLRRFLEEAKFTVFNASQLTTRLKHLNGGSHFFQLAVEPSKPGKTGAPDDGADDKKNGKKKETKGTNVWWVPADFIVPMPRVETPPIKKDELA
jgi:hypothetical protein